MVLDLLGTVFVSLVKGPCFQSRDENLSWS